MRRELDDNMEKYSKFTFPEDIPEVNQEKEKAVDYKVEIKKEDIDGILAQLDEEYHTGHGQNLSFEMAALAELKKNASEDDKIVIGEVEFPYAYYEMTEKRVKEDTRLDTVAMKDFVDSKGKKRYGDWTTEQMVKEKRWGQMFSESYRKDYVDSIDSNYADTKNINKEKELSLSEWADMKIDLKEKMGVGNWHDAIPRAGHMCNLVGFERFRKEVKFSKEDEEGILNEINILKKGSSAEDKEKRRKGDPWELASRIRYVSQFMPELTSRIKLDQEDLDMLQTFLDKKREEAKKDGKKNWDIAYQLCNMKEIERLLKNGDIKLAEKEIEEETTTVE